MGRRRFGRSRRRARLIALAAALLVVAAVGGGLEAREPAAARATLPGTTLRPTAYGSGRPYGGIGVVSGGGNTDRLLWDYPARERNRILDLLFSPHDGAAAQLLKVEIGGDTDSTEGAEPSIERTRGVVDCNRGTDWAMMHAARARNPHIVLAGLEWGAPGWLRGGFWSADNIGYLLHWLGCARSHGLRIDYVGGWNERGYRPAWFTALAAAVHRSFPATRVIASDSLTWSVAGALHRDPAFRAGVAVVGVHHPCRPEWRIDRCTSPRAARSLRQPLWASEESAQDLDGGAQPLARELNLNYVDGRMTGAFIWSALSAFYDDLPLSGRALLLAESPWSGAFQAGRDVWVMAHTTQFTAPGWRYVDAGSRRLPAGGSVVTLRAPGRPAAGRPPTGARSSRRRRRAGRSRSTCVPAPACGTAPSTSGAATWLPATRSAGSSASPTGCSTRTGSRSPCRRARCAR